LFCFFHLFFGAFSTYSTRELVNKDAYKWNYK